MNLDKSYLEAQRIFARCCKALNVSLFDDKLNKAAKEMAIVIADEILRSYPCVCEYLEPSKTREKAYWVDVKYELTKL